MPSQTGTPRLACFTCARAASSTRTSTPLRQGRMPTPPPHRHHHHRPPQQQQQQQPPPPPPLRGAFTPCVTSRSRAALTHSSTSSGPSATRRCAPAPTPPWLLAPPPASSRWTCARGATSSARPARSASATLLPPLHRCIPCGPRWCTATAATSGSGLTALPSVGCRPPFEGLACSKPAMPKRPTRACGPSSQSWADRRQACRRPRRAALLGGQPLQQAPPRQQAVRTKQRRPSRTQLARLLPRSLA
mmetsp:Transcript_2486/g.9827  ORF Transcript_2486/g.9827 Transcript_2486/m.9827 type:complete len:247 (+) Transcript_2486:1356-2096(+)